MAAGNGHMTFDKADASFHDHPAMHSFESWFRERHPAISISSAETVLKLAAEGATVPFMARYRKEQTGNLDEVAIQAVIEAQETWDELTRKKAHILAEIDKEEKLTPELRAKIEGAWDS